MKQPLICEAIRERRVISFLYGSGFRLVEPFSYGMGRKGYELLRGFQVTGQSSSRTLPAWRLFIVDKILFLSVTEVAIGVISPARYPRPDPAMAEIFCQAGP